MSIIYIMAVFCLAFSVFADESPLEPGARLEKLQGGFDFTEGPTCDRLGNVFFVDQPSNRILEWSVSGRLSTFMQPSGHSNGMEFDAQGNLISCADEHNQLWCISPVTRHFTVLASGFNGQYFNGPNDVWISPGGGIYITDPFYRRTWWDHRTMALTNEEVYYLTPQRSKLIRVTDDLRKPNGITGSPDGKFLFISDIGAGQTWRYDILSNGELAHKTLFCPMGSDGMTMDKAGNLFLTGHGVTIFNSSGTRTDHVAVPENWCGNVCFGGPDHKTLFITATHSLYSIRMKHPGANAAK